MTAPDVRLPVVPLDSWDSEATWATFENGTFHGVVLGTEVQKSADDLDRYEWLVHESNPEVLVETGTRAGGSAIWFHRNLGLQVITIDTSPQYATRGGPPLDGPGISWITGSSIVDGVVETVHRLTKGKRVMVSLDSDHHSPHVQAEMAIYSGLVSPGCYLVVEDACFDLWEPERARVGGSMIPEIGGTLDAIRKSGIAHASTWTRDLEVEGLTPISHSPCGWWRKND